MESKILQLLLCHGRQAQGLLFLFPAPQGQWFLHAMVAVVMLTLVHQSQKLETPKASGLNRGPAVQTKNT